MMTNKHIDFTTIREDMSVYEVENGQILKAKQIIVDIVEGEDKKGKFGNLGFQPVSHVASPSDMDTEGLELAEVKQVTEQDEVAELKFTVKKQVINIYETDNAIILVNPKVEKIYSTNKKDKSGMILRFRTGIEVNVVPKNLDGKIKSITTATEK